MNILYSGDPASIHDYKWIKYFLEEKGYNCYFATEWSEKRHGRDRLISLGVKKIFHVPTFSSWNFLNNYKIYSYLKKIQKEYKIDVIHVFIGTSHAIAPSLLKGKKILTTRGSDVLLTYPRLKSSRNIMDIIMAFF